MTDTEIKQLAADVLNGKTTLSAIPRGLIYFTLQNIFLHMGRIEFVREMGILSGQRLAARGYRKLPDVGWVKNSDIPRMGIGLVYGRWLVTDKDRFSATKL